MIVYDDLLKLFGIVYEILAVPLLTVALPIVSPFTLNTTTPAFNAVLPLLTVALTVIVLPVELVMSLTIVVVVCVVRTLRVLLDFDALSAPVPL